MAFKINVDVTSTFPILAISKYVSALTDIGYDGYTCIEIEDKAFEGSKEKVENSLVLSKRYLEQFVI